MRSTHGEGLSILVLKVFVVKTVLFLLTSRLYNGENDKRDYDCDRYSDNNAHLEEIHI